MSSELNDGSVCQVSKVVVVVVVVSGMSGRVVKLNILVYIYLSFYLFIHLFIEPGRSPPK